MWHFPTSSRLPRLRQYVQQWEHEEQVRLLSSVTLTVVEGFILRQIGPFVFTNVRITPEYKQLAFCDVDGGGG